MDNTKKILSIVFASCAILIGYLTTQLMMTISTYFQLAEKFSWALAVSRIVPILLAILTFILLYKVKKIKDYTLEVINEVKKVVWPGKKETWGATVVVIIAVIISGIVLGIFDWISATFLKLILK